MAQMRHSNGNFPQGWRRKMAELPTKELLQELYVENKQSIAEIASAYSTYPKKIQRLLTKYGIPTRDKSDAQKLALKSGRTKHPTKGRGRTYEERVKLAKTQKDYWENMAEEEKEEKTKAAIKRLKNISEEDRLKGQERSKQALQEAARLGSKLEKFIRERLTREGVLVEYHRKDLVVGQDQLEVDIFLPEYTLVIEVDGPSHWLPIFGEESLANQLYADHKKENILLNEGYYVGRVRCQGGVSSFSEINTVADAVLSLVEKCKAGKLPYDRVEIVNV